LKFKIFSLNTTSLSQLDHHQVFFLPPLAMLLTPHPSHQMTIPFHPVAHTLMPPQIQQSAAHMIMATVVVLPSLLKSSTTSGLLQLLFQAAMMLKPP